MSEHPRGIRVRSGAEFPCCCPSALHGRSRLQQPRTERCTRLRSMLLSLRELSLILGRVFLLMLGRLVFHVTTLQAVAAHLTFFRTVRDQSGLGHVAVAMTALFSVGNHHSVPRLICVCILTNPLPFVEDKKTRYQIAIALQKRPSAPGLIFDKKRLRTST